MASLLISLFLTPYSQSLLISHLFAFKLYQDSKPCFHSQCHQFFSKPPSLPLVIVTVTVQPLSHVQLCVTPWTAAYQASLSFTISWSMLKLMSIESVMPSNHLILCCPILLLPSILPSIRVFSKGSALLIRWPEYWSFSFNISPSNEYSGLTSSRIHWLDPLASPRDS